MNLNGKTINPGELRQRVTLLGRAVASETGGFGRPTRQVIAHVWARWTNVHGQEVWAAMAVNAQEPATVLIRYHAGLDVACAVCAGWVEVEDLDERDVYEVVSTDDLQLRHEYIELKVQRVGGG